MNEEAVGQHTPRPSLFFFASSSFITVTLFLIHCATYFLNIYITMLCFRVVLCPTSLTCWNPNTCCCWSLKAALEHHLELAPCFFPLSAERSVPKDKESFRGRQHGSKRWLSLTMVGRLGMLAWPCGFSSQLAPLFSSCEREALGNCFE